MPQVHAALPGALDSGLAEGDFKNDSFFITKKAIKARVMDYLIVLLPEVSDHGMSHGLPHCATARGEPC